MIRRARFIQAVVLFFAAGIVPAQSPDLRLERFDIGERESLAGIIGQGQWAVVNVWSPSCSLCVREMPDVVHFHQQHPDIPLVGVTIDFPSFGYGRRKVLADYLKRQPLDFPLYLTDQAGVEKLLGKRLVAIPLIAIFTPKGKLAASWPGQINPGEIESFINNYDSYKLEDNALGDF